MPDNEDPSPRLEPTAHAFRSLADNAAGGDLVCVRVELGDEWIRTFFLDAETGEDRSPRREGLRERLHQFFHDPGR